MLLSAGAAAPTAVLQTVPWLPTSSPWSSTAFLFAYTLGNSKGIRQYHIGPFTCAAGKELMLFNIVNTHEFQEEEKTSPFNINLPSGARPAASTSRLHPAAAAMLRSAWRHRPAHRQNGSPVYTHWIRYP